MAEIPLTIVESADGQVQLNRVPSPEEMVANDLFSKRWSTDTHRGPINGWSRFKGSSTWRRTILFPDLPQRFTAPNLSALEIHFALGKEYGRFCNGFFRDLSHRYQPTANGVRADTEITIVRPHPLVVKTAPSL